MRDVSRTSSPQNSPICDAFQLLASKCFGILLSHSFVSCQQYPLFSDNRQFALEVINDGRLHLGCGENTFKGVRI
jgi:hypothetical protein